MPVARTARGFRGSRLVNWASQLRLQANARGAIFDAAAQLKESLLFDSRYTEAHILRAIVHAQLLKLTGWSLMPVAPDRGHGLFVTAPEHASWVETLREWCERRGRSHCRVTMKDGELALVETNAPDEVRERAAAAQIDLFLGKMDRYFRLADVTLLPLIQQRLEAARQMRHAVEQAKGGKREPA